MLYCLLLRGKYPPFDGGVVKNRRRELGKESKNRLEDKTKEEGLIEKGIS